jgi:hypothetical protein
MFSVLSSLGHEQGVLAAYADLGFQNRLVDFKGLVLFALVRVDVSHVLSSLGHEQVAVAT